MVRPVTAIPPPNTNFYVSSCPIAIKRSHGHSNSYKGYDLGLAYTFRSLVSFNHGEYSDTQADVLPEK